MRGCWTCSEVGDRPHTNGADNMCDEAIARKKATDLRLWHERAWERRELARIKYNQERRAKRHGRKGKK